MAGGRCLEPASPSPDATTIVWLLHGKDSEEINYFQRWYGPPPNPGSWSPRQNLPWEDPRRDKVDWGGSLVYVPDPTSQAGCRLFAFTGHRTPYFWEYDPYNNKWMRRADVTVPVGEGGSLCYGGIWEFNTVPYAFIYAFVGDESNRFFRYAYPCIPELKGVPTPLSGWTELAPLPAPVEAGGCLAWLPLPGDPEHPRGIVVVMRGDNTYGLYFYDPVGNRWSWLYLPTIPPIKAGAAIAPCADGWRVRFWTGGDDDKLFFVYKYDSTDVERAEPTPLIPKYGAALCQVGDTFYAQFGRHNECQFWGFYQSHSEKEPNGGQTASTTNFRPSVYLTRSPGECRFSVDCPPGLVKLLIMNPAGAVIARLEKSTTQNGCELIWHHADVPAGVYFYHLKTPIGEVGGKLTVLR